MLTKDSIQQAKDLDLMAVNIPEWGDSVNIRKLKTWEVMALSAVRVPTDDPDWARHQSEYYVMAAILSCVGEDGVIPLFTQEDKSWLQNKSFTALERLFRAVNRLNALEEDQLEPIKKNLSTTETDASSSDSPSPSVAPSESLPASSMPASLRNGQPTTH